MSARHRAFASWRSVLCAVGIHGIYFASTHGAFPSGEGDHRYVSIAKLAADATEPSSVIITGQNAGATRYYGGRATMRFDLLDEAWLDRAVDWLSGHGHHPYILLEEWELPLFQQRFAARNNLGALGRAGDGVVRAGVPTWSTSSIRCDNPDPPCVPRRRCPHGRNASSLPGTLAKLRNAYGARLRTVRAGVGLPRPTQQVAKADPRSAPPSVDLSMHPDVVESQKGACPSAAWRSCR
jgi:hypothetical protein